MFKIDNLDQIRADIALFMAQAKKEAELVARGLATQAFLQLLERSPQYSGDFVANWKISVNEPNYTFKEGLFPGKQFPIDDKTGMPFNKGDLPAMSYAINEAFGTMDQFKLGQTIWITNSAKHYELYAWQIEGNVIHFRPSNEDAGSPIEKTMGYMQKLTEVTPTYAKYLIENSL